MKKIVVTLNVDEILIANEEGQTWLSEDQFVDALDRKLTKLQDYGFFVETWSHDSVVHDIRGPYLGLENALCSQLRDRKYRDAFYEVLNENIYSDVQSNGDRAKDKYSNLLCDYVKGSEETRRIIDQVIFALTGWHFSRIIEDAMIIVEEYRSADESEKASVDENLQK